MAEVFGRVEPDVAMLLPCSLEDATRVGQFRAAVKAKVDVTRVCADVAESASLTTGQFEDDYFRVYRVEDFLGFRRFHQNQFP